MFCFISPFLYCCEWNNESYYLMFALLFPGSFTPETVAPISSSCVLLQFDDTTTYLQLTFTALLGSLYLSYPLFDHVWFQAPYLCRVYLGKRTTELAYTPLTLQFPMSQHYCPRLLEFIIPPTFLFNLWSSIPSNTSQFLSPFFIHHVFLFARFLSPTYILFARIFLLPFPMVSYFRKRCSSDMAKYFRTLLDSKGRRK